VNIVVERWPEISEDELNFLGLTVFNSLKPGTYQSSAVHTRVKSITYIPIHQSASRQG
jgi:hypothetical protein